jgi:beta-phosphoglucomutase-like phosphatase (HAD superfamily)
MKHTVKLSIAAGLAAGLAVIYIAASKRARRPSALSETLEHEDHAFADYARDDDQAALDDSIAPGAPL